MKTADLRARRALAPLLTCAFFSACLTEIPPLPEGVQVACGSDADCPRDFVCPEELKLCVPVDGDRTPPLLSGEISAEPPVASAGTEVTVRFAVSEELSRSPTVTLVFADPDAPERTLEGENDGLDWTYRGTITEEDAEGFVAVDVDLVDTAGNPGGGSQPRVFQVDRTPPVVLRGAADRAVYRAGEAALYRVELDEPLGPDPTLTLAREDDDTVVLAVDAPIASGARTSFTFVASSPFSAGQDGTFVATVVAEDLAGNASPPVELSCDDDGCVVADTTAPMISPIEVLRAGADASDPLAGVISAEDGFDTAVVTFTVADAAAVDVLVGDQAPSEGCTQTDVTGGVEWTCEHVAADGEPSGLRPVGVYAEDAAGNRSSANAQLIYDTAPPRIAGNAVLARTDGNTRAQVAGDELYLNDVSALGPGSPAPDVVIDVAFTEALALPPDATLSASLDLGATTLPIAWDEAGSDASNNAFRFRFTRPEAQADGTGSVLLDVTDPLGNRDVLDAGTIHLDATPPVIDQAFIDGALHRRAPWGDATRDSAVYEVLFSAAAEPRARVELYDGPDLGSAALVAILDADATGVLPTLTLPDVDRADVWIAMVDAAGNVHGNTGVELVHGEYVTTLRGRTPGDASVNPHVAYTTTRATLGPTPALPYRVEVQDYAALADVDGAGPLVAAAAHDDWVRDTLLPGAFLSELDSAYNPDDGALWVVLSGSSWLSVWRWDGAALTRIDDSASSAFPPARSEFSVVYDEARDELLLFGGHDPGNVETDTACPNGAVAGDMRKCARSDLWSFAGGVWTEEIPNTPAPGSAPARRTAAGFAWDAGRNVAVLHGGKSRRDGYEDCFTPTPAPGSDGECNDVWEWNGTAFTRVTPGDVTGDGDPDARNAPVLVADATSGVLLLDGSTWRWDGNEWIELDAGNPNDYVTHGALDRARGRVVRFVNIDRGETELQEWNGSAWVTGPAPPTTNSRNGALVLDAAGAAGHLTWMSVGATGGAVWELESGAFVQRLAEPQRDRPSLAGAAASLPARMRVVGFESPTRSVADNTVVWDGGQVLLQAIAGPGPRGSASMAAYPPGDSVLLYGGVVSDCPQFAICQDHSDLWVGDGDTWTLDASSAGTRRAAAMAWDESRGVVVMFGGIVGTTQSGFRVARLHEWDGSTWSEPCPDDYNEPTCGPWPTPRTGAAFAYDPDRQTIVLYGGSSDLPCDGVDTSGGWLCGDVWEWDGSDWTQLALTDVGADGDPAPRAGAGLVYEPRLGLVMHGGSGWGATWDDTWLLEGTEWNALAFPDGPDGRPGPTSGVLARDEARDGLVWFSSEGEVWVLEGPAADRRPAVEAHFSLASLDVAYDLVTEVDVAAAAGGTSATGDGARLELWRATGDTWEALDDNTSAEGSPTALAATADTGTTAIDALADLVRVRTVPLGTAQNGDANIRTDTFLVTVRYDKTP